MLTWEETFSQKNPCLQARQGRYRYQIRENNAQLGPWWLEVFDDEKSAPGTVISTRIHNLKTFEHAEHWANYHADEMEARSHAKRDT